MKSIHIAALLAFTVCQSTLATVPGYQQRYEEYDRDLADREVPSARTAASVIAAAEQVQPEVQNYAANVAEPYSCSNCGSCCSNGAVVGNGNSVGNSNSNNNNGDNRGNGNGNIHGSNNGNNNGNRWSSWRGSGGWRGRRKRAALSSSLSEATRLTEVKLLGSEAEVKLYDSYKGMAELMASPVIRAELYERPLASDVPKSVSAALNGNQFGVVATLSDGRRFFVVKGNQMGRGKETIIILANHMSDDWVKKVSKDVVRSTLADFYAAGGKKFDILTDNGNRAAARMMALP